jgi:hypothetical protein
MSYYRKTILRTIFGSRRRRLLLPGMAALLAALTAAAWIKREGINYHLSAKRAATLLDQSRWAAERKDWKVAQRNALAAWQLHPGEIGALRQLFEALVGGGSGDALAVGKSLFEHPRALTTDRLATIDAALRAGDLVTTASMFSRLRPVERETPEALELGARFFLARNHPVAALPLIDRLRLKRNEPRDLLLAADALTRTPTEGNVARSEAQRILGDLFQTRNDAGIAIEALRLLGRIPMAERELYHFAQAHARLDSFAAGGTEVPVEARLIADELELASSPERRGEIFQRAMDRWFATEPEVIGKWLIGLGETKRFLENVPRAIALENPAMLPVVTQALILENRWDRALSLLDRAPYGTDPVVLHSLRAMIQSRLGQVAESNQNWARAARQAELVTGRSALLRFAQLAALGGKPEMRDEALAEALKRPSSLSIPAADVAFLYPALARQDRSGDLLRISEGLLASEPENPQVLNNVVWLELLEGAADESRVKKLEQYVSEFPSVVALRSTLAFAHLRAGRNAAALEALAPLRDRIEAGEAETAPTDRALVALALAREGDIAASRELSKTVRWDKLMKAERDYFAFAIEEAIDDRFGLDERGIGGGY